MPSLEFNYWEEQTFDQLNVQSFQSELNWHDFYMPVPIALQLAEYFVVHNALPSRWIYPILMCQHRWNRLSNRNLNSPAQPFYCQQKNQERKKHFWVRDWVQTHFVCRLTKGLVKNLLYSLKFKFLLPNSRIYWVCIPSMDIYDLIPAVHHPEFDLLLVCLNRCRKLFFVE